MKKVLKILAIATLILFTVIGIIYLFLTDFGKKDLFSHPPRNPHLEVPVNYNINWMAHQELMCINSLKVKIVESKLNLFNDKSLISYEISGTLNKTGSFRPYIHEVHIAERIMADSSRHNSRIIEITPIVRTKKAKNDSSEKIEFSFTNEHTINSSGWGFNTIKIKCMDKEEMIELRQLK